MAKNKLQIRFEDPTHGKITTKTFLGPTMVDQAINFLEVLRKQTFIGPIKPDQ